MQPVHPDFGVENESGPLIRVKHCSGNGILDKTLALPFASYFELAKPLIAPCSRSGKGLADSARLVFKLDQSDFSNFPSGVVWGDTNLYCHSKHRFSVGQPHQKEFECPLVPSSVQVVYYSLHRVHCATIYSLS